MYSIVLMAAMTAGTNAADFGRRHGCHGCNGGYACAGCYGGGGGCHGWRGRGGYGCNGCYGGGYGCYGGGYGCYGGGYGCYGGSYGCYGGGYGCNGGYGYSGCYGAYSPYACHGTWGPVDRMGPAPNGKREPLPPPKKEKEKKETSVDGPAKLIVELPADAKLYIDDKLMKTASAQRTFNTPKLEAGESYYYVLRAELQVDGKTITENQRVIVRTGETARASFKELEAVAKRNKDEPPVATANRE